MTAIDLLDGPDADGKQAVVATVTAEGDAVHFNGPRTHWAKVLFEQFQRGLAVERGQCNRSTLEIVGPLPSAEDTLQYWLQRNEPPERIRPSGRRLIPAAD